MVAAVVLLRLGLGFAELEIEELRQGLVAVFESVESAVESAEAELQRIRHVKVTG
jgi:hypothetical protein